MRQRGEEEGAELGTRYAMGDRQQGLQWARRPQHALVECLSRQKTAPREEAWLHWTSAARVRAPPWAC